MKFNKQKIEEIKSKIKNIGGKITSRSKEKVPMKYYGLLTLMIFLGTATFLSNIKEYSDVSKEQYDVYELDDKQAASHEVNPVKYITDVSSISTVEPNLEEESAIETISNNKAENVEKQSKYIMPVVGEVIKEFATQKLVYSETLEMWKTHPGIDIKANLNDKVKSASSGTVQKVTYDSFYGNTVEILSEEGYLFVYSNLDSKVYVEVQTKVNIGDVIGTVGVSATGELADQTHIHFEVIKGGEQINPLDLIN